MTDAARRHRWLRVPGGAAGRGVLAITTGTAAAQLLTLAAGPVIARLYSPHDLGIYVIIAASSAILGAVASFRWEFAIPLGSNEIEAHSLVTLGMLSVLLSSILTTAVLLLLGREISGLMGNIELMPLLLLVPLVAAGQAAMKVLNQLAVRHRRYAAIGRRATLRSALVVSSQIGLGLVGMRAGGLSIGLGAGNAAGALSLLSGSGFGSADARRGRRVSSLRQCARHYMRFPLLLTPSSLLNVLGLQLPILLIAGFYGSSVAGWLGLTQTVLALPVALLGQSVAQVYLGEFSRSRRENEGETYKRLFRTASRNLLFVAAALIGCLLTLAPLLFPIAFGENWRNSGIYAQALALSLGLQLVAVPLSQTLVVMGRQGTQLLWDSSRLVLVGGSVAMCAMVGGSAYAAVWAYSLSSALAYLLLWYFSSHAVHASRQSRHAEAGT